MAAKLAMVMEESPMLLETSSRDALSWWMAANAAQGPTDRSRMGCSLAVPAGLVLISGVDGSDTAVAHRSAWAAVPKRLWKQAMMPVFEAAGKLRCRRACGSRSAVSAWALPVRRML